VEVDIETGQIHILKLISAQDAGKILNHDTAVSQIEGAMIMAVGATLMEELKFDYNGRVLNKSFTDYRIPTTVDIPEMRVIFIETEDATGPFGARGLGEHGIVAVPAAIANAVADALKMEFHKIPITPAMVFECLEGREGGGS
jgi:carbon-monoxide dehydrogenase large subunit